MTDDTNDTEETYRPTLGEMSHTNPYTGDSFGDTQTYRRGTAVAADGGRAAERVADEETLQDVDHTPPDGTKGAVRAYERGNEGREDVR